MRNRTARLLLDVLRSLQLSRTLFLLAAFYATVIVMTTSCISQTLATVTPSASTPQVTATPSPTPVPTSILIQSKPKIAMTPDCEDVPAERFALSTVNISNATISQMIVVETASTPSERTQGLMCRTELRDGEGMIFLFDGPVRGGFWMFNTYVPLDIVYVGKGGEEVDRKRMVPCIRRAKEAKSDWRSRCIEEADAYIPEGDYIAALELPSEWLEKNHLHSPVKVKWSVPYETPEG